MVREPELVKRVLDGMKVGGDFERSHLESFIVTALNGKGVHSLDGKKWAIDRQTLNPFFHQEALKVTLSTSSRYCFLEKNLMKGVKCPSCVHCYKNDCWFHEC